MLMCGFGAADNTPSCGFDLCKHFVNVKNCRFSKSIKRKIELEAGNCLSDSMEYMKLSKGKLVPLQTSFKKLCTVSG